MSRNQEAFNQPRWGGEGTLPPQAGQPHWPEDDQGTSTPDQPRSDTLGQPGWSTGVPSQQLGRTFDRPNPQLHSTPQSQLGFNPQSPYGSASTSSNTSFPTIVPSIPRTIPLGFNTVLSGNEVRQQWYSGQPEYPMMGPGRSEGRAPKRSRIVLEMSDTVDSSELFKQMPTPMTTSFQPNYAQQADYLSGNPVAMEPQTVNPADIMMNHTPSFDSDNPSFRVGVGQPPTNPGTPGTVPQPSIAPQQEASQQQQGAAPRQETGWQWDSAAGAIRHGVDPHEGAGSQPGVNLQPGDQPASRLDAEIPPGATETTQCLRHMHLPRALPTHRLFRDSRLSWKSGLFANMTSDSHTSHIFYPPTSGGHPSTLHNNHRAFFRWSLTVFGKIFFHTHAFKEHIPTSVLKRQDLTKHRKTILKMAFSDSCCHMNLKQPPGVAETWLTNAITNVPNPALGNLPRPHERVLEQLSTNVRGQSQGFVDRLNPPGFSSKPDPDLAASILQTLDKDAWFSLEGIKNQRVDSSFHALYASEDFQTVMEEIMAYFNDTPIVFNAQANWARSGLAAFIAALIQLGLLLISLGFLTPCGLVGLTEEDEDAYASILDYQTSWRRIFIRWLSTVSIEQGVAERTWKEADKAVSRAVTVIQEQFNDDLLGRPMLQHNLAKFLDHVASPSSSTNP